MIKYNAGFVVLFEALWSDSLFCFVKLEFSEFFPFSAG